MKFFFGYEKNALGNWGPVLYHKEAPKVKDGYTLSSNGPMKEATAFVAIEADEEPSFGLLTKQYPPPQEIEMVRPVEGFRTKDGQFFETEWEAEIHETVFILTDNFRRFVGEKELAFFSPDQQDTAVLRGLEFILENGDTIRRYLDAHSADTPAMEPEPDIPDNGSTSEAVS
jgi:hypothetical protein